MRGSRLLHRVTPVSEGIQRVTMVNSFIYLDPFREDTTALYPFVKDAYGK